MVICGQTERWAVGGKLVVLETDSSTCISSIPFVTFSSFSCFFSSLDPSLLGHLFCLGFFLSSSFFFPFFFFFCWHFFSFFFLVPSLYHA